MWARTMTAFAALCAASACADGGGDSRTAEVQFDAAPMVADEIVVTGSRAAAEPEAEPGTAEPGTQLLAYSYALSLRLPAARVDDAMAAHRDRCQAAGPRVCQVLAASLYGEEERTQSASLRFRAMPSYVATFRDGLAEETRALEGRVVADEQEVVDLTREILDVRARLEAQETLRDRLLDLLDRQEGALADVLAAERELARVQGTIESMLSNLRALEGRVAMSTVTMGYEAIREPFAPARSRPLADAFGDVFGILAESLAALVRFLAAALPWLVIGLPILWVLLRLTRRLVRGRRAA